MDMEGHTVDSGVVVIMMMYVSGGVEFVWHGPSLRQYMNMLSHAGMRSGFRPFRQFWKNSVSGHSKLPFILIVDMLSWQCDIEKEPFDVGMM